MGGDEGGEEGGDEHAVDDAPALEPGDTPRELGVEVEGVAVAAHRRVRGHVRAGEPPRLAAEDAADSEDPSGGVGGHGRGGGGGGGEGEGARRRMTRREGSN